MKTPDLLLEPHGSVWLLNPQSPEACAWCADNLADNAQMFGNRYAIEARYLDPIAQGAQSDGLVILVAWGD